MTTAIEIVPQASITLTIDDSEYVAPEYIIQNTPQVAINVLDTPLPPTLVLDAVETNSSSIDIADSPDVNLIISVTPPIEPGIGELVTRVATLENTMQLIGNITTSRIGAIIPGQYYDSSLQAANAGPVVYLISRIELVPFSTSRRMSIDRLGVDVTVAGVTGKIAIYSADTDGWPGTVLLVTPDIDLSTLGYCYSTSNFIFEANTQYWLAFWTGGSVTINGIGVSSLTSLGLLAETGITSSSKLRRILTYGAVPTTPWAFVETDRVGGTAPSIRMRAAAL